MTIDPGKIAATSPDKGKIVSQIDRQTAWRAYCEDLVYAACSMRCPGEGYASQIERRRRLRPNEWSDAVRRGGAMHAALLTIWPEAPSALALARMAWGDDLDRFPDARQRRQKRRTATIALCAAWLPEKPPEG